MKNNIISKTFGGLEKRYFIRNLIIGFIFGALCWLLVDTLEARALNPKPLSTIVTLKIIFIVNSLLYPFAKFFYDSLWSFVLGDREYFYAINVITIPFIMLMRLLCWMFACVMAPLGLITLYFVNSKKIE